MTIANLSGSTMSIVAHIDDDLLFQNPNIINAIQAGGGHTTVFMTAGDAGGDTAYMAAREAGAKAAYSEMTGQYDWVDETVTLTNGTTEFVVHTSYLASQPDVRLYFLRLPDGDSVGTGYAVNDYESVQKLWDGTIDTITTKDGENTYTADDISGLLLGLMEIHQPDSILLQDLNSDYVDLDHSDHFYSSQFAYESQRYYDTQHDLYSYIEYATSDLPANLSGADAEATRDAFYAYIHGSGDLTTSFDANGDPIVPGIYDAWPDRHYHNDDIHQIEGSELWARDFGNATGGSNNALHVRATGDINGDGRADIVGFGASQVFSAQSNGAGFGATAAGLDNLTSTYGWAVDQHERAVADVNGDGMADIVAFGNDGVRVSLSDGTRFVDPYGGAAPFSTFTIVQGSGTTDPAPVALLANVGSDGIEAGGQGTLGTDGTDNGSAVAPDQNGSVDTLIFTFQPETSSELSTYSDTAVGSGDLATLEFWDVADANGDAEPVNDTIHLIDLPEASFADALMRSPSLSMERDPSHFYAIEQALHFDVLDIL